MQLAFYIDQTRCSGCFTCAVACKDWYDVPAGPAAWMRIKAIERGKYPKPFLAYLPSPCYHCADPACMSACPVNAITKRKEDGVVVVDRQACLGNKECAMFCKDACPYSSPQFGAEEGAKMQKCGFCLERWAEGKKPICVEGCPMRALDAGPLDEMKAKYGKANHAEGFTFDKQLKPSVVFKPKLEK